LSQFLLERLQVGGRFDSGEPGAPLFLVLRRQVEELLVDVAAGRFGGGAAGHRNRGGEAQSQEIPTRERGCHRSLLGQPKGSFGAFLPKPTAPMYDPAPSAGSPALRSGLSFAGEYADR